MFVRFVVHQRFSKSRHEAGIFVAAYHLRDHGDISPEERQSLEEILEWFRRNLPIPPDHEQDQRAIYWFKPSATRQIERMWELARLLNDHGYDVEKITTGFAGRCIYQDDFQVGAIPHTDRHRQG